MRRRMEEFMRGRYGVDQLANFLMAVCLGLIVLNLFVRGQVLYLLALVILGYSYFRMFSKNYAARSEENRRYLSCTQGIRRSWAKLKSRVRQFRHYHVYKCPSCGQKIRIPRGKGKIMVTCPKCRNEFSKRS